MMSKDVLVKVAIGIGVGATLLTVLNSCKSVKVPAGVKVVDNFNAKFYMGQWFEIARLDFKHERNLSHVTANYVLNDNGSVKVVNVGYDYIKKKWKEAVGKAKFVGEEDKGALKVSFFGPFYSGYNVVAMDPNYENALVFGESTDYMWILSRQKSINEEVKKKFLAIAKAHGYNIENLVWVKHD